jgi:putative spermidine/putrescine transport system ATP-binding protein
VAGLDLDVAEGEFVTLLGPSGSGKTTVLRMIAGFEAPTAGTVLLRGEDVTAAPPFERDVHTVFQDYALFPHLSVLGNVEYPLRIAGVGKAERRERARAAPGHRAPGSDGRPRAHRPVRRPAPAGGARPRAGGPARRAAARRAPRRARPQAARADADRARRIQRDSGITFVLVTHDQDEALTLADRVVVFNDGRVEQAGPPTEVYERPASAFVAGFVGTSNIIDGVSVRPEKISIGGEGRAASRAPVDELVYTGATTRCVVALDDGTTLSVLLLNGAGATTVPARGERVRLTWHPEHEIQLKEAP